MHCYLMAIPTTIGCSRTGEFQKEALATGSQDERDLIISLGTADQSVVGLDQTLNVEDA